MEMYVLEDFESAVIRQLASPFLNRGVTHSPPIITIIIIIITTIIIMHIYH